MNRASAIAQQLAGGARVDDVVAAFAVTRKDVMNAGFDHGLRYIEGKDTFAMIDKAATMLRVAGSAAGTPTPTALPKPTPSKGVIALGLECPDAKVRRAAEKARDAVEVLRGLLAAWEDRASARADVARLEAELAAAKARLTGRPATPSTAGTSTTDNREVRAWAAEQGIACPARGRVPQAVRDAYEAHRKAS